MPHGPPSANPLTWPIRSFLTRERTHLIRILHRTCVGASEHVPQTECPSQVLERLFSVRYWHRGCIGRAVPLPGAKVRPTGSVGLGVRSRPSRRKSPPEREADMSRGSPAQRDVTDRNGTEPYPEESSDEPTGFSAVGEYQLPRDYHSRCHFRRSEARLPGRPGSEPGEGGPPQV